MTWIEVANVDELDDDEATAVIVDGKQFAVYRSEGQFFVSDNVCTHAFALLSEGFLEDGCVECPLHQAKFDIRTGKVLCGPATEDIRVYPVKIVANTVVADLPT